MFGLISIRDLESIDLTSHPPTTPAQWQNFAQDIVAKYTSNDAADPIIPGFLILGSNERARDRAYLASLGVTDVLAMAVNRGDKKKEFEGSRIKFVKLVMLDTIGYPVAGRLRSALHYVVCDVFDNKLPRITLSDIGSHHRHSAPNGHCLFVHCLQGISRSMSFVIMLLMYIFYIQDGERAPDINIITRRVQFCRKSSPNTSFQSQLSLLQDCLCAFLPLIDEGDAIFQDCATEEEKRRLAFDISLAFCEAYFETKWRSLGECIAYSILTVEEIIDAAKGALKLGLSAMSLKKSPLRQSADWLRRALVLDNLSIYSAHHDTGREIATMDSEGEAVVWERTKKAVRVRFGEKRLGLDLDLVDFQDIGGLITANFEDEGGLLVDVPVVSKSTLDNKHKSAVFSQIEKFRLPKHLLWFERDRGVRQARLRWCMGFAGRSCDTGKPWCPIPVINEMKQICDEACKVLEQIEKRFECRTWTVWLITRAHFLCRSLSSTAWNWVVRYESHKKAMELDAADAAVKELEAAVEKKGSKKRVRYEDVSVDTLRKEVARLRRKLLQMSR